MAAGRSSGATRATRTGGSSSSTHPNSPTPTIPIGA